MTNTEYRLANNISSPMNRHSHKHTGMSSARNIFSAGADSQIPFAALTTGPKLENIKALSAYKDNIAHLCVGFVHIYA